MLDNAQSRARVSGLVDPVAATLLKIGLSPDAITWIGAIGSVLTSALLIAHGKFLLGALVLGVFSLSDLLDGTMARMEGRDGPWGAFLDSTLDRVSDASVLCALIVWFAHVRSSTMVAVTAAALVTGFLTSYIRARAEAVGVSCKVGFAERAERSIVLWVGLLLAGCGLPVLSASVCLLAVASTITVAQRMLHVRNQLSA